jgi:polar amino acid transport system permease protein
MDVISVYLKFVLKYIPVLFIGLKMTLFVSALATLLGIVIGLIGGLGRVSKIFIIRIICSLYVQLIRGIPLLVFLMFIYFGIGSIINIQPLTAAISGLGIFSGAYIAEIVRGGIESVPRGQWEAAQACGLKHLQIMKLIIIPQALRAILPALAGQFIILIKDSSLAYSIGIVELTLVSNNLVIRTFKPFEIWALTAAIYFILTYNLSAMVRILEKRYKKYDM